MDFASCSTGRVCWSSRIPDDGSRFLRIQSVSQDQNIRKIQLVSNWLEAR
jgi:hypothetical protein